MSFSTQTTLYFISGILYDPQRGELMTGSNNSSLSRRSALRRLAGGASVAILAACAPSVPATQPAPTAPSEASKPAPAPPTAQRRMGGTLRVAVPADISSLDGHTSSSILGIT